MNTISLETEVLFKDRGSKFFAYAKPMSNPDDIKGILNKIKAIHPKARHFCYAFRLRVNGEDYFITNDDGEPSNSAGAPILGQIKSFELYNTCIVVVRYFGGTKLGVSGLINAYKVAAKEAIDCNKIVTIKDLRRIFFSCHYENLGKVISLLNQKQVDHEIKQQAKVQITMDVEISKIDDLKINLNRLGSFS